MLIGRLLLNALLFGNISSLMYSVCGGLLSFAVMCLAMEFIKLKTTSASILGGISHNIGQLTVACLMMNTSAVWVYLPYLIIGGTLAGMLNGMMVRKIFGLLGIYTRFGNFWGTFEDFEKMTEMSLI